MTKRKAVTKRLRKGKFYFIHEGSPTGHPGMIYWKSDRKNLYLSLTTGTSYSKDLLSLTVPTDTKVSESFVNKKPFLGKRKDYGSKELANMKFSKEDKRRVLREISKKEPRYSKNLSRKDKRFLNICLKEKV